MAKKKDLWELVHKIRTLIIVIGGITAMVVSAVTYFAKAESLEMTDQRLALNISQDIINSKESNVRWMKQQVGFQRKKDPYTLAESDIIKEAESELAEYKSRHFERIQRFEAKYGEEL